MENWAAFGQGFALYIGVIIALGPQNLFVLRQGLRRRHVFATALVSSLADVSVTLFAVGGLGMLVSRSEFLMSGLTIAGVAFLLGYGIRSLRSGHGSRIAYCADAPEVSATLAPAVAAALAFALLNPGAYVDTFLILGPFGWQYDGDQRAFFVLGAIAAATT